MTPRRTSRRLVALSAFVTALLAALPLAAVVTLGEEQPAPARPAPHVAPETTSPPRHATPSAVAAPATAGSLEWRPWSFGSPAAATAVVGSAGEWTLAVDARGSDAAFVHGVALVDDAGLDLERGVRARVRLEWRPPENGCYRGAGLLLTSARPSSAGEAGARFDELRPAVWLGVEGVPPGRTARLDGGARLGPLVDTLFSDGWPADRAGRVIDEVHLELEAGPAGCALRADGLEVARGLALPGERVWVVLYTTSHGNYGPRPVTFHDLRVEPLPDDARRTK